jgi:hypothetical protein
MWIEKRIALDDETPPIHAPLVSPLSPTKSLVTSHARD